MSRDGDGEGFLNRWSRRKLGGDEAADGDAAETRQQPNASASEVVPTGDPETRPADDAADGEHQGAAPDQRFEDIDYDKLDADSDYTQFMGDDVPQSVRNQALQRLWLSDPVLANVDGLTDYSEDFTDAALAVPLGALKTAHKVGRGFLSDEDVEKWDSLGRDAQGETAPTAAPPAPDVVIAAETPAQDDVRTLFAASSAYSDTLYPADSNHPISPEALVAEGAVFLVARQSGEVEGARGRAVGCGALRVAGDSTAELKRMWVEPEVRGQGVGRRLLDALLDAARSRNVQTIRLETGIKQPEAIALYERAGFERRAPFGSYAEDPNSIFMELALPEAT